MKKKMQVTAQSQSHAAHSKKKATDVPVAGADLDCRKSRTGDSQNFKFDF